MSEEVRALLWRPPGPGLVAALADLPQGACAMGHASEEMPGHPPAGAGTGTPCACQVVVAAAWEAVAAWVGGRSARSLVTAAGPSAVLVRRGGPFPDVLDPAREELALALRMSPGSMGNRIAAARELAAHPGLLELQEEAGLSGWAARLVVLEVRDLPEDLASEAVTQVVAKVRDRVASGRRQWTSAEVGRTARRVRARVAPEHARQAREQAWRDRSLRVFGQANGMATVHAVLDATDALRIERRVAAIARGIGDPTRTQDQIRADVLVDLLLHGAPRPAGSRPEDVPERAAAPLPAAPRAQVNVVVSLATVLGLSDAPGEVPGLGPVPSDVARALAADGTWRAWVTDATTGHLVATGSRSYVPSAAVARLVRGREPHCRMPGCRALSEACDLDHAMPWPAGETSPSNLGPACRRHHNLKTHGGWRIEVEGGDAGGDPLRWRWRTPAGLTVWDEVDPPLGG
jgi:hypothetical protein